MSNSLRLLPLSGSTNRVAVLREVSRSLPFWASIILLLCASQTPGFFSLPNMAALAASLSLIGCVAVGMTFITISGNIMSFALGATCAATSILAAHFAQYGLGVSLVVSLGFAVLFTGVQGWLIGLLRANGLILSIAALALLGGAAQYLWGGHSVYTTGPVFSVLGWRLFGLPAALYVLIFVATLGQFILKNTELGRQLVLIGSNAQAARAAGLNIVSRLTYCYMLAGLFAGVAGVLIAARFGTGTMEYGVGLDYSAISAVLVGGNAIAGGHGSVWRTLLGAVVIAALQSVLLLNGLDTEYQYFLIGIVVFVAVAVQYKKRSAA